MTILPRVCAEFRDKFGQIILTVAPQNLLSIMDAPESIREDPLFDMMLADGSLEAVQSVEQKRKLESDPVADTTAEGKKPRKTSVSSKSKSPEAKATSDSVDPGVALDAESTSSVPTDASPIIAEAAPLSDASSVDPDIQSTGTSSRSGRKSGK